MITYSKTLNEIEERTSRLAVEHHAIISKIKDDLKSLENDFVCETSLGFFIIDSAKLDDEQNVILKCRHENKEGYSIKFEYALLADVWSVKVNFEPIVEVSQFTKIIERLHTQLILTLASLSNQEDE